MGMKYTGSTVDLATAPNAAHINLTTAITLSAWIKFNTLPTVDYVSYLTKNDYYFLQYDIVSGFSEFGIRLSGTIRSVLDGIAPAANTWFHIAGTYNKANLIIYRNGLEKARQARTANIDTTTAVLSLAVITSGIITLADQRIYNRALSAGEILTMYACKGHDRNLNGLVARYLSNEKASGTNAGVLANAIKDVSYFQNHASTGHDSGTGPQWSDRDGISHKRKRHRV